MLKSFRAIASIALTLLALFFTIVPCRVGKRGEKRGLLLNFATVPPAVVLVASALTVVPGSTIVRGLLGPKTPARYRDFESNSNLVPLNVVTLFFGLAYACLSADASNLFKLIAEQFKLLALKSRNKRLAAMLLFFAFAGVFTLCTSNDIVILCLTPIILEFIQQTGDDLALVPLLLCQFCSANTFSISLLTGNPSNFILTSIFGINFMEYLRPMVLVGVAAGAVVLFYSLVVLKAAKPAKDAPARYQLKTMNTLDLGDHADLLESDVPLQTKKPVREPSQIAKHSNSFNLAFSGLILLAMLLTFMFSGFIQKAWPAFDLSYIAIATALIQLVKDIVLNAKKQVSIRQVFSSLPWGVPLFLVSMFILVENAISVGLISDVARFVRRITLNAGATGSSAVAAVMMVVACVLFNNLPGTIIVSRILNDKAMASSPFLKAAALSAAAGSNYGALFLPHCSLAGLMWSQLVNKPAIMPRIWLNGACVGALCGVACVLALSFSWKW